jgi:hypothetical protein
MVINMTIRILFCLPGDGCTSMYIVHYRNIFNLKKLYTHHVCVILWKKLFLYYIFIITIQHKKTLITHLLATFEE